jgi:sterol desaturase/sphingolipid hydroxylase (fatty acid hydroxylase superfamily)
MGAGKPAAGCGIKGHQKQPLCGLLFLVYHTRMAIADKEILYQAITLIGFVLVFDLMERKRPGHPVDRRKELGLNILAIIVVIVAGEVWQWLILSVFKTADLIGKSSPLEGIPAAVKIFLGLMFADFSLYWVHRGMHWNGRLWRTHVFHHSIEHLWWLSGSRTSLTHLFLFAFPQVLIAYVILGLSPAEAGIAFSIGVFVNIWIHTNIWVDLGPLTWLLITPNYHRIHHGSRGLLRTNLGFIFTVWDRMFGTYTDPRSQEKDFPLGFIPTRNRLFRMIIGY